MALLYGSDPVRIRKQATTMVRQRLAGERGQGILEFAVIFPLFAALIFVVIDGGILMGRYNEINHATKEGSRLAATGASLNEIGDRVAAQAQGIISASAGCAETADESICVYYAPGPGSDPANAGELGSTVKVTVRHKYKLITPLPNWMSAGFDGFEISACAISRLEKPVPDVAGSGTNTCD